MKRKYPRAGTYAYRQRQMALARRRVKRKINARQRGYVRTTGYYGRFTTGGELKFHDTSLIDATIDTTLATTALCTIAQGDTESERIGRKITIRKINIKGAVRLEAQTTAGNNSCVVRLMVIQDKQTNGAAFAGTDIFETDAIESFNNLANSSRFRILWSKEIPLSVSGAAASGAAYVFGAQTRWFKANIDCNIPIEYDNSLTTGAISTIRSNNIYWGVLATDARAALEANCRVRFSDH